MEKILKMFSKLVMTVTTGEVSGASRWGDYQPKESETLIKLKKF